MSEPERKGAIDEDLLRQLAPQVLGALVRRYGRFDTAEDAVQLALLAAATQWPAEGIPDNPKGWLITVAGRRMIDLLRAEQGRNSREARLFQAIPDDARLAPSADAPADADDSLILLFMCCHPSLSPASQIALTLRAVGGLSTAEIGRAFLVPESTMTRRITRAKETVKNSGAVFSMPVGRVRAERLGAVLHVLYLIFNEGYSTTAGPHLHRVDLSAEAIRLTRMARHELPDDSELAGLLALMLLTDARRLARTGPTGALIPMAEQNRGLWSTRDISEGLLLISEALPRGAVGPYQLQAAIAAVHAEARTAEATDWPRIVSLYDLLLRVSPSPIVALNRAVAVCMAQGAQAGLALLGVLETDARIAQDHRLHAARAHMLEMVGDRVAAREAYLSAAAKTPSHPVRHYLTAKATRLMGEE